MHKFFLVFASALAFLMTSCGASPDICQTEVSAEPSVTEVMSALVQIGQKTKHAKRLLSSPSTLVNPSGAAAPLNEQGYSAVADRCCQAEMMQFIERTAFQLGYEACIHGGLSGLVRFHSCESGVQTFAALESDILSDTANPCTWLGLVGKCLPRPDDCPNFAESPPASDCGCSRSEAAKFGFGATTLTANNLGGVGPLPGAQEIRYSRIGTSSSGVVFDLVITVLGPYEAKNNANNGVNNAFGIINIAPKSTAYNGTSDFKFSFMSPGTNTPVVVSEVHMALFDLDIEGSSGATEVASSKGYRGYVTDVEPTIVASRLDDGRTKFSAALANLGNPTTPIALTSEQRRNSMMYFYRDTASFELTFGMEGPTASSGRNLFFAFESSLNDRCGP